MGIGSLLHKAPLPAGRPAPVVSLTADDGAWVRTEDQKGRYPVVLLFFRDAQASAEALRAVDRARPDLEAAGARVYGITHAPPPRLRALRDELGLGFQLLYDLLALESRAWHQSGLRPYVRDGWALIATDGTVAAHVADSIDADAIREAVSRMSAPAASEEEGRSETQVPQKRTVEARDVEWSRVDAMLADPQAPFVLIDVRTPDEYGAIHHPLARNIPVDELPNRVPELPARARVICYCQTGSRATAAVGYLLSSGFTEVYNVKGGIAIWPGAKSEDQV